MGEFGSGNGDHSWRQPRWENPPPAAVAAENRRRAECATGEIVRRIQPTVVSEERRRAVVDYVQRLIGGYLRSEVFPFGSVPLKTYLPDGDIDLTALGFPNAEDTLAMDVCSILESEEQNLDAEFEVKDVQYIQAEVKLVKCLVQNIVVDISFNQIGGLCTLCFLEQVDRLIGKDNLFKRSIILIKAWCYYESRILGAHHGLISTYALETLVLHIFHLFHSSLDGPLAVLYRFLDYYSKFDWDSYCISLHGPVAVSSLPQLVSQPPENEGGDLLLSSEFLKNCMDMFLVPSRGLDMNSRVFLKKHLNIVDPLKENNNLGRSVSKGNFYRIRSAFSYGARKLGRILLLPRESIAEEINMFFMNTLERHGSGQRPDVQGSFLRSPDNMEFDNAEIKVEKGKEDRLISGSSTVGCHVVPLCDEFDKIKISNSNKDFDLGLQSGNRASSRYSSAECLHRCTKVDVARIREGDDISGRNFAGDAQDLASSQPAVSTSVNEISRAISSNVETGVLPCGKAYHASHPFYRPENGRGIQKLDHTVKSSSQALMLDSSRPTSYEIESSSSSSSCLPSNHVLTASASLNDRSSMSSWNVHSSQNSCAVDSSLGKREDNGTNGSPECVNLLDLTGDYNAHFKNLLYTQWCQDYMLGGLVLPNDQTPSSHFRNSNYWDFYHRRSLPTHMNSNGVVPGPPFSLPGIYPMHPPLMPAAYASEDIPKPRGTGTYFPNTNYQIHRERQPPGRGRAPVFTNQMTRLCNKGPPVMPPEISAEKGRHETYRKSQSPSYSAYSGDGQGRPVLLDIPQHSNSNMKGILFANGYTNSHEGRLEFGSFNSVPYSYSSSELGKKLDPVSPKRQGSGLVIPATTVHKQETGSNNERTKQAYQLKDEDDFPPLT